MGQSDIGHFDLLFTVMYASTVVSIFGTVSGAPLFKSFEFFMGLVLLIIVVDHWLLHYRNKEQILVHPYFSLVSIMLVLFFYETLNRMLCSGPVVWMESRFWFRVILLFTSSFFMKWFYRDKLFYRMWDVIAIATCIVYMECNHFHVFDNGMFFGLTSLIATLGFVLTEICHCSKDRGAARANCGLPS